MISMRFSTTSIFSIYVSINNLILLKKLHSDSSLVYSSFSVSRMSILVSRLNNGLVILLYCFSLIYLANIPDIFSSCMLPVLYILELNTSTFDAILRARDGIGSQSNSKSLYSVVSKSFKNIFNFSTLTFELSFMSANMMSFNTLRDISLWSKYCVLDFRMQSEKMGNRFSQIGLIKMMIM